MKQNNVCSLLWGQATLVGGSWSQSNSICAGKSGDFQRGGSPDLDFVKEIDKEKKGEQRDQTELRQGNTKDASTTKAP